MGAISPMATEERMVGRKVIEELAHQGFICAAILKGSVRALSISRWFYLTSLSLKCRNGHVSLVEVVLFDLGFWIGGKVYEDAYGEACAYEV